MSVITSTINRITSLINGIIKEDLGLDHEYDFAFFLPKEIQKITLYYVNDIEKENENVLVSTLDDIKLTNAFD